jgi:hypothetical protein
LLQPELSLSIFFDVLVFAVMAAIKLDQASGRAKEVHDEWAYRRLPPEVSPFQRKFFECSP